MERGEDLRGFEWRVLWQQSQGDEARVLAGFPRPPTAVAVSPDDQTLAIAGANFLWRWTLGDAQGIELLPPKEPRWLDPDAAAKMIAKVRATPLLPSQVGNPTPNPGELSAWINPERIDTVTGLFFTPDGRHVVSSAREGERAVRVWSISDGALQFAFPAKNGDAAVSPTGPIVAAGSNAPLDWPVSGCVKLYDLAARSEILAIPRTGALVALSSDGQRLVTAGWDGSAGKTRVEVWSPPNRRRLHEFEAERIWTRFALSPDGRWIAAAARDSGQVEFWSVNEGRLLRRLEGHAGEVHALNFSPDSQLLASAGTDAVIRLWSAPSGELAGTRKGHADQVESLAFFHDGQRLASASRDGTVRVWPADVSDVKETRVEERAYFARLRISPEGRRWVSASVYWRPRTIGEMESGAIRLSGFLTNKNSHHLGFDKNGSNIVAAAFNRDNSRIALEWRAAEDLRLTRALEFDSGPVNPAATAYCEAQEIFAAGLMDGTVKVWSARTGAMLGAFNLPDLIDRKERYPHALVRLAISQDGALMAARGDNSQIAIFSLREKKLLHSWHARPLYRILDDLGSQGGIVFLDFSPDGKLLVSMDETESVIRLWDPRTGKALGQLAGHRDHGVDATFSPDGRTLASTGRSGSLKLWHLPSQRETAELMSAGAAGGVAFTPDGAKLVVAVGESVRIFDPPLLAEIDLKH